ncbi:hypothetical protein XENOCAPTIV_020540 [Xenoophorus captivus]|uniref:Uncharacterized protein n=1 Tax=Xenoophorus captivus TaxID=1517983 RepID=A0ABV0RIU1_9TELE
MWGVSPVCHQVSTRGQRPSPTTLHPGLSSGCGHMFDPNVPPDPSVLRDDRSYFLTQLSLYFSSSRRAVGAP